jgi:hypothetical protein
MAFTVTFEGAEELKQALSAEVFDKKVVKAIGSVTKELHNILNNQVKQTYMIGNRSLNSVLIGSTESNLRRGAGFISSGLVYEGPRLPISAFPTQLVPTGAKSQFVAPNIFTPDLSGKIKRKKPVDSVVAHIRRNRQTLIKGAFKGKVNAKIRVLRRGNYFEGGQTWIELPTRDDLLGVRESYYEVNGPSLPEMAGKVYDENKYLIDFRNNFADRVMEKLDL